MTQIKVNGISLEYESRGEGEVMLLLMGLGAQMTAWPDEFINELVARGFRVIWFDNRDVGLSSKINVPVPSVPRQIASQLAGRKTKAPYIIADMAADTIALLDALQVDRAHLVGVSMGAMIAQTMAFDHPERVRSLASIMSNTGDKRHGLADVRILRRLHALMDPSPAQAVQGQVALFNLIGGPLVDDDEVRRYATLAFERNFDRSGVDRQLAAVIASPDRTERLAAIEAPTLVIHGLADSLVGYSGATATAKAIPNARLLMFPDMGHDLPRSLWPEMIDAIIVNSQRSNKERETP